MFKQTILLALGFFLVLAVLAVVLAIVRAFPKEVSSEKNTMMQQSTQNSPSPRTTVTIRNTSFAVDVADTTSTRTQGLSGRTALGPREGMLFIFPFKSPQVFWMKDMLFPIDIIWVKDGIVTGITENAMPEPKKSVFMLKLYSSPGLVNQVLEVPAGTKAKFGIEVGDIVGVAQ